jgi:DNA-binding CsgD family transcriptional regulator
MAADVIGVLEAGYDLDGSDEAWLARVVAAAHPAVDRGLGLAGFFFRIDECGALEMGLPIMQGVEGVPPEVVRDANQALDPETIAALFVGGPPCVTMVGASRYSSLRRDPLYKRTLRPYIDVPDYLGLRASSAPREGAAVVAPLARIGAPPPREAMLLSRLASHIGAGLRLRRRLAAEARAALDDADAILTPSGKLEHAAAPAQSKGARAALATATRLIDRARGRLRRAAPDEALGLWRALVAGQWSLVDCFDHDGRRFVVAHRNQMLDGRRRLQALSDRERQAATLAALGHGNKLIAYDLGVSVSTVSMYLARAAAKLGASSRTSLIQILKSLPSSG